MIRDFGEREFDETAYFNFDEIQDCPRAIQSLKYFCENMPELHVIAAGSLLGVALRKEGISFPVGKVDRMEMFPISFEEFVRADGGEKYINSVQKMDFEREIPELYTIPLEKDLKNYYIVGGMPEAVQAWIDTHDYREVEEVQDRILRDYADDFGKYTSPDTATKIRLIWDAIPSQIAKDNNKFIFSHVKHGARAKDLEDALDFITDYEGVLLPIEVKSADNTKAKSLRLFCNRYNPKMAVKMSLKNVGDNKEGSAHVWSIPLYLIFKLKKYISHEMGWETTSVYQQAP